MTTDETGATAQLPLSGARPETLAIRSGIDRTAHGEHSEAIFTTSSYVFDSCADAAARFSGEQGGNVYSRYTNPTVAAFEQRLASLEGAEVAIGTASGMSAILATCMAFLQTGDHVVCSRDVFGSTVGLFEKYLPRMGIAVSFVSLGDLEAWRAAVTPATRLFYCETPSNPICEVADVEALSALARSSGARLVVDNCFCTPALQQPLALGADVVIHSATKYLDGQGRMLGGAVLGSGEDMAEVRNMVRTCGPSMSPFNAWVFLKGLETLSLRMKGHCENALGLAHWLQQQAAVATVHYAGLTEHPGHLLARRQQQGFGGVLSFELRGGQEAAWRFIDATALMSLTANLGDVKTTIVHPATTTHGRLSAEQRALSGIAPGLVRIAVGLEHLDDIKADCERGFSALGI